MNERIDMTALEKELAKSFNELDALSNPTKNDRSHSIEDLWVNLKTQGILATKEDQANTEKYVEGNMLLADLMSLIQKNHPEIARRN